MENKVINVERDFSRYPAGRFIADGPYSGEKFRKDFLVPALSNNPQKVTVELDGARGYGSSFLEEAFGGLVRREGFSAEFVLRTIEFKSDDVSLIEEIRDYILESSHPNVSNKH